MRKLPCIILIALIALALIILPGCGQTDDASGLPSDAPVPSRKGQADDVPESPSTLRVSFIDVGKGDCILVQSGGSAALIDTGYEDTADDVASYLRSQGVGRLDFVILTHYDRDHVGGIGALGEAFPIGRVYLPGYEGADKNYRTTMDAVEGLGLSTEKVTKDTSLQLGDAQLMVYATDLSYEIEKGGEGNDNDLSLVVALTHGNDSYLFAGDLEKEGIAAYLDGAHGQFDVLKMPHHGEKSGNTDDLIEDVGPEGAVITDSAEEPADKKVRKLLEEADVDTYRTATDGTIVVESDGTGSYRVSHD